MSSTKKKIHFAWFVLIGLCITVGLGKAALNNTASLFISPVAKDLGVGVGNLTLYLSISSVVTMIFLPIGGKILTKFNTGLVLIIAVLLQAGSFALFGFMHSVWGWYALSIPLAVGGVFITVLAGPVIIQQWFKKRNGIALGIMSAVGGLFGIFTQPIVGKLISDLGWRTSYYTVGLVVIIILVPTIFLLLRYKPQQKNLVPYGMESGNIESKTEDAAEQTGIAFKDASKSPAFILLGLFFFIVTAVASFSMHVPTYLVDKGYDVTFAGNAMAAMALGIFVGSLTFGYLSDRIGAKNTSLLAMVFGTAAIVLLLAFPGSTAFIIISLILFGFMSSSIGTLGPAMASSLFGSRDYSQIYSTASIGLAVASIIALPAYGYIFDFTGTYVTSMYAIVVMLILNMVFIVLAFRNKEKLVKAGLWK
ncbi:MFS family permease [Sporosarcina luteola]|nr:MFS family permease [Sporosarcina luteola]